MSQSSRIIWRQGTFLQPHHFQQLERSLRADLIAATQQVRSRAWGFSQVEIDRAILGQGQFALSACAGRFPDGTCVNAPDDDRLPQPIAINAAALGKLVYLGVPLTVAGRNEFGGADERQKAHRFTVDRDSLRDNTDVDADPVEIEIGRLDVRLLLGDAATEGYSTIPLARIQGVDKDGVVTLADSFIPSVLHASALEFFRGLLKDIHTRMSVRARDMAGRSVAAGRLASSEHFLEAATLMAMNRYLPVFDELAQSPEIHPYDLYLLCIQAAGELSTFAAVTEASPRFDGYQHKDLYATFKPVMTTLFQALGHVIVQSATRIELPHTKHGIHLGKFMTPSLASRKNQFVLCITADLHPDELRRDFPRLAKIAPAQKIIEFVNNAVPGVPMRVLTTAPPEIRFPSSRSVYLEIDAADSPLWDDMRAGLAIHAVLDKLPSLKMELWVIAHDTAA